MNSDHKLNIGGTLFCVQIADYGSSALKHSAKAMKNSACVSKTCFLLKTFEHMILHLQKIYIDKLDSSIKSVLSNLTF